MSVMMNCGFQKAFKELSRAGSVHPRDIHDYLLYIFCEDDISAAFCQKADGIRGVASATVIQKIN